ncbi:MAG: fibronectin type III domain-containing protein, partial [Phycisphaerae bacterium]
DFDGDGAVGLSDFNIIAENYGHAGRTFSQGDANYDGIVDLLDYNILASNFGKRLEDIPTSTHAVTAHLATSSSVSLTWPQALMEIEYDPITGGYISNTILPDGYAVFRSNDSVNFEEIFRGPLASFGSGGRSHTHAWTDTGVEDGTKYWYRVRPYTVDATTGEQWLGHTGEKDWETTLLPAPTNLTATPNAYDSIDLTWNDNSQNEDGFLIEASIDGGASWQSVAFTEADATSYTLDYALPQTEHSFRVSALNAHQTSATTPVVTALTYPQTPYSLNVSSVQPGQVDLEWDALQGVSYELERSLTEAGSWSAVSVGTPGDVTDTGVTEGRAYDYRLRAVNATSASDWGDVVTAGSPPATPIMDDATFIPMTDVEPAKILVEWSDESGNETGYRVEYRSTAAQNNWRTAVVVGPGTQDVELTNGLYFETQYDFRVVAETYDAGDSEPSGVAAATFGPLLFEDFEDDILQDAPAVWSNTTITTSPSGEKFLGRFGDSDSVDFTMADVSAGDGYKLTFDFYAINSWDGDLEDDDGYYGPDSFEVTVGEETTSWTFRNITDERSQYFATQSYPSPGSDPTTGAAATGVLGYTFNYGPVSGVSDAKYEIEIEFDHPGGDLTVAFAGDLTQPKADESWGIDNVKLTPPPLVSVEAVEGREQVAEGGATPGQFRVWAEGVIDEPINVNLSTGGSATGGTDYLIDGADYLSDVTLTSGSMVRRFDVAAIEDAVSPEPAETVILSVLGGDGYRQGTSPATVHVVEVAAQVGSIELSATTFGDHVRLRSDDGSTLYDGVQWLDGNGDGDADDTDDRNWPVALVSGSTPTMTVQLNVTPSLAPDLASGILVRANGPDGVSFDQAPATYDAGVLTVRDWTGYVSFTDDMVQHIEDAAFTFEMSLDDGTTWLSAGTATLANLYLLFRRPLMQTMLHSVAYISTAAADGATTEQEVFDGIWNEFKAPALNVERAPREGHAARVMTYYGSWETDNTTAEDLIAEGDGQCSAWALLLLEGLTSQGVQGARIVQVEAGKPQGVGIAEEPHSFFIKNWDLDVPQGHDGSGLRWWEHLNLYHIDDGSTDGNRYAWTYAQFLDQPGIKGQGGVENPRSWFKVHYIVERKNLYYDPSYGKSYTSKRDFELKAVAGTALEPVLRQFDETTHGPGGVDLNGDGQITPAVVVRAVAFSTRRVVNFVRFTGPGRSQP